MEKYKKGTRKKKFICDKCNIEFIAFISKKPKFCSRVCFKSSGVFSHNIPHTKESNEKNRKAHLGKEITKLKGHPFWGGENAKKNWFKSKNGKYEDDGYIKLYLPKHSLADKKGTVKEHLKVLYDNGIILKKGEVCHHINGNRSDNRIENLEVLTRSQHGKIHNPKGKKIC